MCAYYARFIQIQTKIMITIFNVPHLFARRRSMLAEVSQGSFLDGSSIPTAILIFREQQGSQCEKSKKH